MIEVNEKVADVAVQVGERVAGAVTYTASGSVVVFGWLLSDISMAIAAIVAVLGFLTNLYFKHCHLELEKQRMQSAQRTGETNEN